MGNTPMGFSDINRSLNNGDLIHKDLSSKSTKSGFAGRVYVWVKSAIFKSCDYKLSEVAEAVLHRINTTDISKLSPLEKKEALSLVGQLRAKLERRDDALATRLGTTFGFMLATIKKDQTPPQGQRSSQVRAPSLDRGPYVSSARGRPTSDRATQSTSGTPTSRVLSSPVAVTSLSQEGTPLPLASARTDDVSPHLTRTVSGTEPQAALADRDPPTVIDRSFKADELATDLTRIFTRRGMSEASIRGLAGDLSLVLNANLERIGSMRGECLRFHKGEAIDVGDGRSVRLPFSAWLKVNEDGTGMRLQIIPPKEQLGKGGYKKVKKSFTFYLPISRKPDGGRDVKVVESVIQRTAPDGIDTVKKGLAFHRQILARTGAGVRLASAPDVYQDLTGKRGGVKLEMHQEWYNGDLAAAIHTGSVPLDIDQTLRRPISASDKLTLLSDLADSLKAMHAAGLVHRDVKPANVLLKDEDGKTRAYLADFDLTTEPGLTDIASRYFYWDKSSQEGSASFAADVMGFTMTMAETIIPGFYDRFHSSSSALLDNPKHHRLELSELHLKQQLQKMGIDRSSISIIVDTFKRAGGYTEDFNNYLRTVAQSPGIAPELKEALIRLSVETTQFNTIFDIVSNVVSRNKQLTDLVRALSPEDRERLRTDADFAKSKFDEFMATVKFPSIDALGNTLGLLQQRLAEGYARFGLA